MFSVCNAMRLFHCIKHVVRTAVTSCKSDGLSGTTSMGVGVHTAGIKKGNVLCGCGCGGRRL